jgi:hypothetical protein
LNLLIKGILKEDQSVEEDEAFNELLEFDFYINSKPIVTTLDEFVSLNDDVKVVRLNDKKKTIYNFTLKQKIKFLFLKESLIEIEYTEKCPPPKPVDSIITDDWISSIRANED